MIITTTNNIDTATITEYKGLVSANIVIGANFFSDFAASLTDIFGGQSASYQNKLDELYEKVIDNIKLKATNIGADAIIGLKIDFDEISGKGKSMFMVTAIGTAVKLKSNNPLEQTTDSPTPVIDVEQSPDVVDIPDKIEQEPTADDQNDLLLDTSHRDNIVLGEILSGNTEVVRELLVSVYGMDANDVDPYIEGIKNDAGIE